MNFIKGIIEHDLYCKNVNLRIGNKAFTSTVYSKIITKIVFIALIIYFVNIMIGIFERKRLITNTTIRKTYPRPNISLNSNNFKFAFAVFDSDGVIIQQTELEKYYIPFFYLLTTINQGGVAKTAQRHFTNISSCTLKDFSNIDEDYIYLNNLTSYSCPNEYDFVINGDFDEIYTNVIVFRLDYCNSTVYNNCKPIDEIAYKLNGGTINVYLLDHDVDVKDYENPFIPYLHLSSSVISTIYQQSYDDIYFKKIEIQTDQYFFLNGYQSKSNFQMAEENIYVDTAVYLTSSTIIAQDFYLLNINVYGKVDTITRSYDKIWDGISSVGGIMKVIIGIGILLTRKYNENEESMNLIQSKNLFNIKNYDHEEKQRSNKSQILKNILKFNFEITSAISLNRFDNSSSFNLLKNTNKSKEFSRINVKDIEISNKEDPENCQTELEKKISTPKNCDSLRNFRKTRRKPLYNKFDVNKRDEEIKVHNFQNEQIIENNEEIFKNINENFKKKIENIQLNHKEFHFDFCEKLTMSLGIIKKNKKNNIFLTAKQNLDRFLDIEYILEKLRDVEIIKKVIFNKNQLEIFNIISKLYNDNNTTFDKKSKIIELIELLKYLQNKRKLNKISEIDHKLGKLILKLIQK